MIVGSTLASFQGRHDGESVVVCGCGPSLTTLAEPQRFTTIGVNDVGRLFDPDYLVVVNPRSQFKADRFVHVERSQARALFTQLDLGLVRPTVVRFKLGRYGGTDTLGTAVLHYTQNSPYVAVCLAALMGARRIGLIGVDFTDHHFFAATGRHVLAGRLREIDQQYAGLAQALQQRGIELVNLSPISRLSALPRMRISPEGTWQADPAAARPAAVCFVPAVATPGSMSMKVCIEKRSAGLVSDLLETLAGTVAGLGHAVSRDPRRSAADPRVLSIVWNGRGHLARGPTLYCEHGWLPRSDYQISPCGINADSHAAPFVWDGRRLTPEQDDALDARMAAIKTASFNGYYQYMQANQGVAHNLPPNFLLVPLQIESDTNIVRHAPAHLRSMQGLIDHVARVDPPWPVIFKQHPADLRHGNRHLRLRMRRAQDLLWPQARGNIHQMLKSGYCRGILTINSNVAHDGLLWDVPAIVLGRNVWSAAGEQPPFLTALPRDWSALEASITEPAAVACRRAYAQHLIQHQWSLADARDPQRVAALLASAARSRDLAAAPPALRSPIVTPLRRPGPPLINVVAEDKGWLFERWKQALASTPQPGFKVMATQRPLPHAQAWVFIRAKEAATSPDVARSVVQLHDLFDDGRYRADGERAAVAQCAGISLTHPLQQSLLAGHGIDLARRRWIMQPVGWSGAPEPRPVAGHLPTVAWIGRPASHGGVDVSGLDAFVQGARALRGRARVLLIGERLDAAAAALRAAGVDCRSHGLAQFPIERASAWLARFDAVAISAASDSGPWPLFDALQAGVPVVATRVGWTERLLGDGSCGRLVDEPAALGPALCELIAQPEHWRRQAATLQACVAPYSQSAWAQANLQLAADLSGIASRQAA